MKLYNIDERSWTSWDHVKTEILFKYVIELANQQAVEIKYTLTNLTFSNSAQGLFVFFLFVWPMKKKI